MEWTDISITVAKRDADTAEAIATMVANGGIYIEDYSDLEQQAWEIAHVDLIEQDLLDKPRDIVIVHMYLAPDENPAEVLPLFEERLKNSGIGYQLNTTGVEQEDWQNAWKKYYHAMDIGERLAIVPGWEDYRTDRIRIVMDPGMAFGTGTHETTSLCLETLDSLVRGGERVLDIGTGSGILAIAALKLGADSAEGVDIDPMCVRTRARTPRATAWRIALKSSSATCPTRPAASTTSSRPTSWRLPSCRWPRMCRCSWPRAHGSSPAASSTSARTRCWPG